MMRRIKVVGKHNNTVVITRHKSILRYLEEVHGLDMSRVKHVEHAKASNVRGRDVIGSLPLHLAVQARTVTVLPLKLPRKMRGRERELTFNEVCEYAGDLETYVVEKLSIADWVLKLARASM